MLIYHSLSLRHQRNIISPIVGFSFKIHIIIRTIVKVPEEKCANRKLKIENHWEIVIQIIVCFASVSSLFGWFSFLLLIFMLCYYPSRLRTHRIHLRHDVSHRIPSPFFCRRISNHNQKAREKKHNHVATAHLNAM